MTKGIKASKGKGISIEWLADQVNELSDQHKYFWAFGLLQDTTPVWEHENNYALLNETSQTICDTVFLSIKEKQESL